MQGMLDVMQMYTLTDMHGRTMYADSSVFCENKRRFRSQIKKLDEREDCKQATSYLLHSIDVLKITKDTLGLHSTEMSRELKSLHDARIELDANCERLEQIKKESVRVLTESQRAVRRAHTKMTDAIQKNGTKGTQYQTLHIVYQERRKQHNSKRRSYAGKIERLEIKINKLKKVIQEGELLKESLIILQKKRIAAAEQIVYEARTVVAHLLLEYVGDEAFIPAKIQEMIRQDPDISKLTASRILAITPKYTKTKWNIYNNDPTRGTLPLIASCILDNPEQSMAELIVRVCVYRNCQFTDAMVELLKLREENKLFCIRDYEYMPWSPGSTPSTYPQKVEFFDESSLIQAVACEANGR